VIDCGSSTHRRHTRHRVSPSASPMTGSGGYPVRREPVARMSEAICGITADPHVDSLMRATITKHNFVFSRRDAPEFCKFIRPKIRGRRRPSREGAGKTGCALHPRSRVPMHKAKNAHEHTGSAEAVRPSLRNGFTAYFVLSPARPGLFATVTRVMRSIITNLTPATGASGPHDFAVRFTRCSSKARPRPPLPAPTSVTMANAPSLGTGWQGISR